MRKENGKKKVSDSGTDRNESDRRESDFEEGDDGSSKEKSAVVKIFVHGRKHERSEKNRCIHRCTRTCFICKIPIKTNINYKVLEMHH